MDQPKVRKLGVFKSAAIITCNQPFDQGIVDLIEEYLCLKKIPLIFLLSPAHASPSHDQKRSIIYPLMVQLMLTTGLEFL